MDRYEEDQVVDLREYIATLRNRRFTVLLVLILVVATALGLSFLQDPTYTAQSRVLVEPTVLPSSTNPVPPDVNLETEREIAASEPVAALVIDDLGLDSSIDQVLANVDVEGVAETEVLRISYSAGNPELARDGANSFAENYIGFRQERALRSITSDQEAVQERVDTATEQLAEIENDINAAEESSDEGLAGTLETQRNVLIARLGVLQQRLDDVQSDRSAGVSGGQIIEEAETPLAPSSPNYTTNAILAGLLGLGLGVGLAFVRERLDDRFRGRDDVEKVVGAPVLATVPGFRQSRKKQRGALIAAQQPAGTTAEVYRALRTSLQFIASQRKVKSFLVTSSSAGEGKTVTTANLAVVLAQAGNRVIVVSADMRRPTLGGQFGLDEKDKPGLSTYLVETSRSLSAVVQDPGMPNLRVLACGPLPPNPAELLSSGRLSDLIEELEANADFVLIDSPPVLAVADASILASRVGGIVLVIDASTTQKKATVHAKEELERIGGRVVGAVLNNYDRSSSPYYYGPYNYYPSEGAKGSAPSETNGHDNGTREKSKRRLFQRS